MDFGRFTYCRCFGLLLHGNTERGKLTPDSVFVDGDTVSAATEYVSPIDFEKAREENRDIYAWIKIPGLRWITRF